MRLVDVRLSRRDLPHSGDRLKSCLVSKKPSPVLGTYCLFASINLNHVIYLIGSIYHGPPPPNFSMWCCVWKQSLSFSTARVLPCSSPAALLNWEKLPLLYSEDISPRYLWSDKCFNDPQACKQRMKSCIFSGCGGQCQGREVRIPPEAWTWSIFGVKIIS